LRGQRPHAPVCSNALLLLNRDNRAAAGRYSRWCLSIQGWQLLSGLLRQACRSGTSARPVLAIPKLLVAG
jgi:hypothetical protein